MEKTPNVELKAALFAALTVEMKMRGFSLRSGQDRFVRRRGQVTDLFQLVCLDGKPGYRIQPNVGVSIAQVEDILRQTSGLESTNQKDPPTMGSSIGILQTGDSRSCEFLLVSKPEVSTVVEKIVAVFLERALPYYERWGSLAAVDAELNDKPAVPTHHRPLAWARCSTGIIVARLVGRPDYDQLAALYTEIMTRDNKGFYLKRFQALLRTLELVAVESGLA